MGASLAVSLPSRAQRAAPAATAGASALPSNSAAEHAFTRGVGIYPGAPAEYFGPTLVPAGPQLRNLALHRPAYHSSSYDYNLTAQLVTDGIRHADLPRWLSVAVDGRTLPRQEREVIFDGFAFSTLPLPGTRPTVDVHLGGAAPASVDSALLFVWVARRADLKRLRIRLSASLDGHTFQALGEATALSPEAYPGVPPELDHASVLLRPRFDFPQPMQARVYRIEFDATGARDGEAVDWRLGEVEFEREKQRVAIGGPFGFVSAWKPATLDVEWVSVDLGAVCTVERAVLHWILPAAEGRLQSSPDGRTWHDLGPLPGSGLVHDLRLPAPVRVRYVRALLTRPVSEDGYLLSEFEVWGRGGLQPHPHAPAPAHPDGDLPLSGGAWRVQRAEQAAADGPSLARTGFDDSAWLPATVPGTVLTSFLNAGALPDPNFGENQLYLSDSFFCADFWYRTEFPSPPMHSGGFHWLCFRGINWKAEVFLNGERLGHIEGCYQRARFDITARLLPGQANALAVRIERNATPGSTKQKVFDTTGLNGGALGADNPTFHASVGWDWIPTIRGRNTGIWGEVTLCAGGAVTLADPAVSTVLPSRDNSRAEVTLSVSLTNHARTASSGTLRGQLGSLRFEQPVSLPAGAEKRVSFSPRSHPQLAIADPQLWWPCGYGEPHLHEAEFSFEAAGQAGVAPATPPLRFHAGLREITASEDGKALRLFVNGCRVTPKGGNWGFAESMLRYRAREYDTAVRYHRAMNFNMIRNWVGQIPDDAFYEACDRHGILVWQDFCLANPYDGPEPNDNALFLANARDLVSGIRRHPSLALYCGRNEGYPPPELESGLRALLAELHPDLHYIPSSADDVVSGHGPYHALPAAEYFRLADRKLHSEIGAPAIPPIESVRAMLAPEALWPQGLQWGLHDYTLHGAQGALSFESNLTERYGGAESAEEWVALAQFINYETYRAMFEAQSEHRMGVLLWMSHPCWPSFVWQTYDYYFEPTSAYFACQHACEPLHIQWNPLTGRVEVVNAGRGAQRGLTARCETLGLHGEPLGSQSAALDAPEDTCSPLFPIQYPDRGGSLLFLRLTLLRGSEVLSTNTYLRPHEEDNLRALRTLPPAQITASTRAEREPGLWKLTTELRNTSAVPALMVRVQAVRETTGDRILPAVYSDNYIFLMPGQMRVLTTELQQADTRGERPRIAVSGFNVSGSHLNGGAGQRPVKRP